MATNLEHRNGRYVKQPIGYEAFMPVEDGFGHPAESIIGEALSQRPDDMIMWLRLLVSEEKDSRFVASVIKRVTRVVLQWAWGSESLTMEWLIRAPHAASDCFCTHPPECYHTSFVMRDVNRIVVEVQTGPLGAGS